MDPEHLIEAFGTIGLLVIVFAESGLLIGFFLPGDSLLVMAGILAARGRLNIAVVVIGCALAAIAGDQVGYAFGARVGPALFRRPDSRLFKHENVVRAQQFFERHGSKTIVLARFVPIVRTFAPIVAGIGSMPYRTFVTFNVLGGVLWGSGLTLLGYGLAQRVENHILQLEIAVVVLSLVPIAIELVRARRKSQREASKLQARQ